MEKVLEYIELEFELSMMINAIVMTKSMIEENQMFGDYYLYGFLKNGKIHMDLDLDRPKKYDVLFKIQVAMQHEHNPDNPDTNEIAKYYSCVELMSKIDPKDITLDILLQFKEYLSLCITAQHDDGFVDIISTIRFDDIEQVEKLYRNPNNGMKILDLPCLFIAQNDKSILKSENFWVENISNEQMKSILSCRTTMI